jgi:hypothetical protein
MHCEDSEWFGDRVERREGCKATDLDDGAANFEHDLVSLWRRDNRVNRRMACPRDGIADDIVREIQLRQQMLRRWGSDEVYANPILEKETPPLAFSAERGRASGIYALAIITDGNSVQP